MSGDRPTPSFGDPTAQPSTPEKTPISASFPSPAFATPRQIQGTFAEPEPGSWTPRFAEEYSVFNSTPGNLGAPQGRFGDFAPGHRRFSSSDSTSVGFRPHAGDFSTTPCHQYPSGEPTSQFPPTSHLLNTPKQKTSQLGALPTPNPSLQASANQSQQASSQGSTQTQTATPPPTNRKDRRKFAPDSKMQQDGQDFSQSDFVGTSQGQDFNNLLGSPGDLFSYPMSAPATGPDNFWDPSSLTLPMDMDISTENIFPPDTPSGHRHTGSFDWNSEVQMFQDLPQPAPPASKPEKGRPAARKTRTIAPKPQAQDPLSAGPAGHGVAPNPPGLDNPFGIMGSGEVVDPGILFSRFRTGAAESGFNAMNDMGSAQAALATSATGRSSSGDRRSASFRGARNGNMPDRPFVSSPAKPSAPQPRLPRSQSENGGRRSIGRGAMVNQPAVARPLPPARNGSGVEAGRNPIRTSGRLSPLKKQHRTSLASIPESAARLESRASVKFYIGADGRAHAEVTHPPGDAGLKSRGPGSHTSADAQQWDEEDDSSSTDDEPIIIPSRNNSFNSSFALPDPRRPVGSIFHPSRRSISDRSTSTLATSEAANAAGNDAESEAETVMDEDADQGGADAANELLKVKENRQHGPNLFSRSKSQHLFATSGGGFHGNTISPTRTDSGNTTDEPGVRCVCHRNEMTGFLVQCESCEMWQHGQCINQRTQPRVYICAFCANTPNMRGGRRRGRGRAGELDIGIASSPLASKSFRSLR